MYHSWKKFEFAKVGFEERGKLEYPEKDLSKQGREPILGFHMTSPKFKLRNYMYRFF